MENTNNNNSAKIWTAAKLAEHYHNSAKTVRGRARSRRPERANEHTKRYPEFAEGSAEYDFWMSCIDMAKHEAWLKANPPAKEAPAKPAK